MNLLKLSDIKKTLSFRIQKGMSIESIERFAQNSFNDTFDFDVYLSSKKMNLQRPLVWTLEQKQEFILSVIKGIQISALSVIRYREKPGVLNSVTMKFIDGKQRFTTIMSFYKNEFPIEVNGVDYFYFDMEEECQRLIKYFSFHFDIAYEYDYDMISDDDKIAWFEMINFAGTPQDVEHLKDLKS